MKSKALIGIAVASAFGWAATAQAGPYHHSGWTTPDSSATVQSGWVSAGEERYPPMVMFHGTPSGLASSTWSSDQGMGSTSAAAGGSGSFSSDTSFSSGSSLGGGGDDMSSLSMDDSLNLASEGIYSDYYIVGWTPSADLYVLEPSDDYLVVNDDGGYIVSTYDVTVFPSDYYFGSPDFSSDSGMNSGEDFSG